MSFSKNSLFINGLSDWNIIPTNKNNYKIQNKNGCFIKIYEYKILCTNITIESASHSNLLKYMRK